MTIIRVSLVGMTLDSVTKSNLAKRLIEEFATVEVGRFSEPIAAGFTLQLEEVGADNLWMGLKPAVQSHPSGKAVVISAQVMAGPWNAAMKEELFARLDAAVREILKIPKTDSDSNIWMTVTEISGDSFSVGGKVVSIAQLSPFFTADRQKRIGEYVKKSLQSD
ncbi:MAG: hypothetical protein HY879_25160 [Deltaproteobacteria bacterium]|nr:hypothetical protein [Deltaproteobacteria bacterium]